MDESLSQQCCIYILLMNEIVRHLSYKHHLTSTVKYDQLLVGTCYFEGNKKRFSSLENNIT